MVNPRDIAGKAEEKEELTCVKPTARGKDCEKFKEDTGCVKYAEKKITPMQKA